MTGLDTDFSKNKGTVRYQKISTQAFFMYCYVVPPCNKKNIFVFYWMALIFLMKRFKGM